MLVAVTSFEEEDMAEIESTSVRLCRKENYEASTGRRIRLKFQFGNLKFETQLRGWLKKLKIEKSNLLE